MLDAGYWIKDRCWILDGRPMLDAGLKTNTGYWILDEDRRRCWILDAG
jgi:hypothetical protein